jgi:hypothetical protein
MAWSASPTSEAEHGLDASISAGVTPDSVPASPQLEAEGEVELVGDRSRGEVRGREAEEAVCCRV